GMAQSLTALQRLDEAVEAGKRAIGAAPESPEAHYALAAALDTSGRKEEAAEHFAMAARLSPQSRRLQYIAAAVQEQVPPPPTAPSDYVRVLFGEYAASFDHHLTEVLKWR